MSIMELDMPPMPVDMGMLMPVDDGMSVDMAIEDIVIEDEPMLIDISIFAVCDGYGCL